MMGGVSGHAGLFSDASDLAIIAQMLLQKGEYARDRLLKKETIEEFTAQQYTENENRRGIVFDKPEVDITKNGPTAKSAPYTTFGHTGFTGTCLWVDPDNNLVYIFLSNRVYPDAANNKLANLNIRTEIQQVIYDAIRKAKMVRN
jgi:CubicO group peptidase (beta-lactamase class C family)